MYRSNSTTRVWAYYKSLSGRAYHCDRDTTHRSSSVLCDKYAFPSCIRALHALFFHGAKFRADYQRVVRCCFSGIGPRFPSALTLLSIQRQHRRRVSLWCTWVAFKWSLQARRGGFLSWRGMYSVSELDSRNHLLLLRNLNNFLFPSRAGLSKEMSD